MINYIRGIWLNRINILPIAVSLSISNLILIITTENESGFIRVRRIRIFLLIGLLFWGFASLAQVQFVDRYSVLLPAGVSYGTIDNSFGGPGISFADFDNDGLDDITIPASNTRDFQFFRNTGGQFQLENLPISSGGSRARQAIWVDYDNDGDNDFFAVGDTGGRWFYRNEGNGVYTDILTSSGLALQSWEYWGISWGDYNNDGNLDAFLLVRDTETNHHNLLYRNEGDGTFTDVTVAAGLTLERRLTLAATFVDYNRDGYQDLFLANDKETIANQLFLNRGDGTFQDVSIASSMDLTMDGMSATIGDYNRDGWTDIYITNGTFTDSFESVIGNAFMQNNKDGTYTNVALENGTRFDSFAWGSVFLDSELDGDLDLYVSSYLDGSDGRLPSTYYENDGSGNYSIPANAGFQNDILASYGNAIGDIQNDGLPDIVVVNIDDQPLNLWENQSTNTGNWLKVKLEGTTSNRMGVGSFIKVKAGDNRYYEYTACGEGYISQNSTTEFFGIGDATAIDYIQVRWLSGQTDRIDNIAPNQTITIVEGSFPAEPIDEEGGGEENNEPSPFSVARQWNEVLLDAIREDLARPTVHARNLFHSSVAMFDAWALFDDTAETVFLGKQFGGYRCEFNGIAPPQDIEAARNEVMSYALFRLLNQRFTNSPGANYSLFLFSDLFSRLGYDPNFTDSDYGTGSYAALGNYLGAQLIQFGLQDGANESADYANQFYTPVNEPLSLEEYLDDYELADPNRWQPLIFESFVDQSGNVIEGGSPEFLSPEWGAVIPFAHKQEDLQIRNNGFDSYLYDDPGSPPEIQDGGGVTDPYKWNFALVAAWSAHLDPNDTTLIDISPGAIGNVDIAQYPQNFQQYSSFYNFTDGGDPGMGHTLNPATGQPYEPQLVKRADYARVLAEFWADGPDSETPPGHWFTILNYVSDHPETVKQINGEGPVLDDLEWDVKTYLALGGAMHDAAVSAWGVKGYYDYIRPISAIRYMASQGQSSDPGLPSYDPHGIPLVEGLIELIEAGDPLEGPAGENMGKVKIFAWKGPDYINDPTQDVAGVDWILGTRWWPYQRPDFVTPPFAGYVSGHSTFSRAAAEVMTSLTGDQFFPGGMGIFDIQQNNFLVFEQGPSENLTLQWATYQDASDQTSLSRIWGGIHPPVDDIPGRIMGDTIGKRAYSLAEDYFNGLATLSADNFLIQGVGETCVDQDNGRINILAKDYYDYVATLSNTDYQFNRELVINGLAPGTYPLCIRVEGSPETEQCFDLVIPELAPLDVNSSSKALGSSSTLRLEVRTGTPPFYVEVNKQLIGTFDQNSFDVSARAGDTIKLYSSKACEGIYSKTLPMNSTAMLYPNPAEAEAAVLWTADSEMVEVGIFNLGGQMVSTWTLKPVGNEIRFPTDKLSSGIYIVKIKGRETVELKLVKK
ncbi:FG-GAP-like repeat-containing protein [Flavobacteriaceae bacterium D16]|nr:FG-GAP-like repeat-containing protein [Flavobacteriaceae bacterium D16]